LYEALSALSLSCAYYRSAVPLPCACYSRTTCEIL